MDIKERANMVRAMETVVRNLNNEDWLEIWLTCGVADGDIDGKETDDDLEIYCRDDYFADLMALFARIMRYSTDDNAFDKFDLVDGNHIFYCDNIVSCRDKA